ncbi:hypothetical protein B0H16DRAFT_1548174 [Mycena metata]|uniref:Secreted protein n=1 Tax=Mycena metata TaxID=1033252 RepID=A0AAD7IWR7_9AGAR|nr:hypothetical protein B0H16DRAFT_1548174 [Mycena metata]
MRVCFFLCLFSVHPSFGLSSHCPAKAMNSWSMRPVAYLLTQHFRIRASRNLRCFSGTRVLRWLLLHVLRFDVAAAWIRFRSRVVSVLDWSGYA